MADYLDNFESGVGTWTTSNASVSQSSSRSISGSNSLLIDSTGSLSDAKRTVTLPTLQNGMTISFWFNIDTRDNDDADFRVGGWGCLFERETRSDMYWLYPGSTTSIGGPDASGINLSNDVWYKIEYFVDGSNTKARLYDASENLITEQTKSPSAVEFTNNFYDWGDADGGWRVYIDDIYVDVPAEPTNIFLQDSIINNVYLGSSQVVRAYKGSTLFYGEAPLSIPTYVQGINRSVNGPTYLFYAQEAANRPSPCTSGDPNAYAFFDLRGIAINSIDFVFDFRYYNAQPRIGTRSAAPTTTITFDGAQNEWLITDLTPVDYENLFDTYGGSGSDTDVSRSYTYSGRTDLILQIGVGSCQALTDRFVGIKSLTINGINITQFANNNNQTAVSP